MLASKLTKGDRIETEYGPATVVAAYPDGPTGQWGATKVIVHPDGYAATRTVTFAIGEHATML